MSLKWKRFSDDELVLQIQKGEKEAFTELASRYLPLIHRAAVPYRSSLLETEDLAQEGLIGLFFAAGTYHKGRAAFSTSPDSSSLRILEELTVVLPAS